MFLILASQYSVGNVRSVLLRLRSCAQLSPGPKHTELHCISFHCVARCTAIHFTLVNWFDFGKVRHLFYLAFELKEPYSSAQGKD